MKLFSSPVIPRWPKVERQSTEVMLGRTRLTIITPFGMGERRITRLCSLCCRASNAKQTRDAISALQLNRRRSGARAPAARHAPSNSEAETLSDGSGWSDSEEAPASTGLASPQRSLEAPGASEEAASPAVGPPARYTRQC